MNSSSDTEWFMEQVGREQSRLRAFIRSLGIRAEAVDDIAQDALLGAYERLDVFRREEDFGAWVRGIARRLVANALRKEHRRQQILSDQVTELFLAASPEELHPLAETADEERLTASVTRSTTPNPRRGKSPRAACSATAVWTWWWSPAN